MLSEYDRARQVLLDHYATLNVEGKITEEEMESKMDRLDVLPIPKVVEMWKRLKRKNGRG